MKKLLLAPLVAAAFAVPNAEADYRGNLERSETYTVRVEDLGTGTAMMIIFVDIRKGRQDVERIYTVGPMETNDAQFTVPNSADRVIIEGDARSNGFKVNLIRNGVTLHTVSFDAQGRVVYDVVDAVP